ncbi:uncharacterized protein [Mytilus edulis]|uniref:uncharacterized protein n=2 Tax=Mytilus edulis TaxID=6550 RepID=UPI0039EF0FC0
MDIILTETNKGKRSLVCDSFRYRVDKTLKGEEISWRCTAKGCKARLRTDCTGTVIIQQKNTHNHDTSDRDNERHLLRVRSKKKADDDIAQRPSKIIRTELQNMDEANLKSEDIGSVSKAIYRKRRKSHPALPKSREETHQSLKKINIQSNKFENFVQFNDEQTGIIILTCPTNLECLCSVPEIFMDGTYKYCPKFFKQLYTIHGYNKGNYVPLVFCLLPGKSEEIYVNCFSSIVKLCSDQGHTLQPKAVHVDFEERVMKVMKDFFPSIEIKCCRFHLGQAWWRKIQKVGLSQQYKELDSDISKWLKGIFGIAFLAPDEVADCFVEDFMAVVPNDKPCIEFADYLTDTYITDESLFPPHLWAEVPSSLKRTNNGPESFHAHYNEQFYHSHPSIYIFLDTIIKLQSVTYIKIRSLNIDAPQSRTEKEKEQNLRDLHSKYCQQEITRDFYVRSLGYKFQARTDL